MKGKMSDPLRTRASLAVHRMPDVSNAVIDLFDEAAARALARSISMIVPEVIVLWTALQSEYIVDRSSSGWAGTDVVNLRSDIDYCLTALNNRAASNFIDFSQLNALANRAESIAGSLGHAKLGISHIISSLLQSDDRVTRAITTSQGLHYATIQRTLPDNIVEPVSRQRQKKLSALRKYVIQHAFTDDCCQVILRSVKWAWRRGISGGVSVELALWSALRWERKLGISVLEGCDVDLLTLERSLESVLGPNRTPGADVVVDCSTLLRLCEVAQQDARDLGQDYVGIEHLICSMCHWKGDRPIPILQKLGVTRSKYTSELMQTLQT